MLSSYVASRVIWVATFHAFGSAQECYWPDATVMKPYWVSCNASASQGSACCGKDDICTTTGLCIGHAGYFYRGGCTVQNFQSDACADVCMDGVDISNWYDQNVADSAIDTATTFANLMACNTSNDGSQLWCCSAPGSGNCCNRSLNFLVTRWGEFFTPSNTFLPSASTMNTASVCATTTVTATLAPSSSCPKPSSTPLATTVGVAIGVPLGALAIAVIGFLFARKRTTLVRKKNAIPEIAPNTLQVSSGAAGYKELVKERLAEGDVHEPDGGPAQREILGLDGAYELSGSREAHESQTS